MKNLKISGSGYSILAAAALILLSNRGITEEKYEDYEIVDHGFTSDKSIKKLVDAAYGDKQQPYVLRQLDDTVEGDADENIIRINRLFKFATAHMAKGEIEAAISSENQGYEFMTLIGSDTARLSGLATSGMTSDHANSDWWKTKKAEKENTESGKTKTSGAGSKGKGDNKVNTDTKKGNGGKAVDTKKEEPPAGHDGNTSGTDVDGDLGDKLGEKNPKADFEREDLDHADDQPHDDNPGEGGSPAVEEGEK